MCPCFTTFVLLAIVAGLVYKYLTWNFGYWKRLGIKEAASYAFCGSFPSQFTQKRNVIYDIDDLYRQHKKDEHFVGVIDGRTPKLLVLSKEYARKIFVSDFRAFHDNEFANFVDKKSDAVFGNNVFVLRGEEWKERRAEITPGLTNSRVKTVYPVTKNVCKAFANYIKTQSKMAPQHGLEAKELCFRYTCEVVSDVVLGIKANSFTDKPLPVYDAMRNIFSQSFSFIFYGVIANLVPQIRKIYTASFVNKKTETFLYDLMQRTIQLRREQKTERADFMEYILHLQDKKNLDNLQLTAHTVSFLTDGFETTASVLAHTLLLLGRHPETQERLRAEVGTEQLDFDELSDLPYLDACVYESIRIFSPLLYARKICTETYEFVNKNGTKVTLKPGDVALIPVHSIHHDSDIYEDPEAFKPERLLNGGLKKYRDMGAYFGFGDGPRICLGMRFALTQVKTALVEIVRDYTIKVNPKTRSDNYMDETYFMALLKGGLWLDFEERI